MRLESALIRRFRSALAVAVAAFITSIGSATIYYVDDSIPNSGTGLTSFANAKKTIQEVYAIPGFGVPGDVVLVGQGLYTASSSGASFVVELKPGVSIQGGYAGYGAGNPNAHDPDTFITTITGDYSGNDPVYTDNASRVVFIPDGVTAPGSPPYVGANEANLDGFRITAGRGNGGIFADDTNTITPTTAVIRQCMVFSNVGSAGGGVYVGENAEVQLRDCQIYANHAFSEGGGIAVNGHATLLRSSVYDNTSDGDGGGIKCLADVDGSLTLVCSSILRNVTDGQGGGISCKSGGATFVLINSLFIDNTAVELGGGIEIATAGTSSFQMTNCTVSGNSLSHSGAEGGGLYFSQSAANSFVKSSIFWDNTAANYPEITDNGNSLPITYSDVELTSGIWSGTGNINDDPDFVGSGNYRLTCTSPCINTGDTAAPNAPGSGGFPVDTFDVDEDGNTSEKIVDLAFGPRILGSASSPRIDIGAYESHVGVCGSDINGDGTVNIHDLLAVIAAWGLAGNAADVDPPCAGDGIVNIMDLLQVITDWGACGMPEGMPESIEDCFNIYCVGLSGTEWSECIEKCAEVVCYEHPEECE